MGQVLMETEGQKMGRKRAGRWGAKVGPGDQVRAMEMGAGDGQTGHGCHETEDVGLRERQGQRDKATRTGPKLQIT